MADQTPYRGTMREGTSGTGESVDWTGQEANRPTDQAQQQASQVTQQAQQQMNQVAQQAQQQAKSRMSDQKQRAAEQMGTLGYALRQTSEQLRGQDQAMFADYADTLAQKVEDFSHELQNKDVEEIVGDVERFARRQPALFLGGAFVLGLLGARFLKSSSTSGNMGHTRTSGFEPGSGRVIDYGSETYYRRHEVPGTNLPTERPSTALSEPMQDLGRPTGEEPAPRENRPDWRGSKPS